MTTTATTRIAVLVGSLRADSLNRRLAEVLRERAATEGIVLDLLDEPARLPFYDEGLDGADAPADVVALRDRVAAADAVLAVTPEYNGNLPAVVANAIDWLSRPYGAGAIVAKPFAVVGVTPTPYGGKWAHEVAQRSAGVAGARVLAEVTVSQSALEVDVLTDPEVLARFDAVLRSLAAAEAVAA